MAVVDSLRTLIKNTSGATKTFSFIPPHGKRLADDEETSVLGDIVLRLSSTRAREAYESAVASVEITVRHTPAPIIVDDDDDLPKQLTVDAGTVAGEDPILPSSL